MKEQYCKFCGRDLDNGACSCEQFFHANKLHKKQRRKIVCDTCKAIIDEWASYCPYCGIPVNVDGNIETLQDELKGKNALDVIEVYRKRDEMNGIRGSRVKNFVVPILISLILLMSIVAIITFVLLRPYIVKAIDDYKYKVYMESVRAENIAANQYTRNPSEFSTLNSFETETSKIIERETEPASQPLIEIRDKWLKSEGYFYAFDSNGDPVIDDWVVEVDADGNEKKYYFDIDGRLVVNSWIDGEYFVGADGAMLKDVMTPDGAMLDEDGRVLLQGGEEVPVERETYVYYEQPNSNETIEPTTQRSSVSGELRGVDENKTYELYVKSIRQYRDTVTKGDDKCNISFYMPIIAGASEREVNNANAAMDEIVEEYRSALSAMATSYIDLPKSITFNIVEQRNVNSNRMTIISQGTVTPKKGFKTKRKFRFVYDRKSKKVMLADISD